MITKKHKSRMYNMKHEKVLTSSKMRISRAYQGEAGRRRVQIRNCQSTLLLRHSDQLQQSRTVQTLGSGHEDPGLLATPASTYDNAKWRA